MGRAVEVFALVGFAVVNPVLGPFGESPSTFLGAGASAGDIVRFALAVALVPFVILVLIGALSRLAGRSARAITHLVVVGLLAGVTAEIVVRHMGAGPVLRWVAFVVVGVLAGFARSRWKPVQYLLRYASPAPVLFVMIFLFSSPVAPLVTGSDDGAKASGGVVDPDGDGHPHVMVIVIDEVSMLSLVDAEGTIDSTLYPNVARLADTGTTYRNHTTVAPSTRLAMPSIVTGVVPRSTNEPAPVPASYPDTLFTLLSDTHRVHGREHITELCSPSLCPPPADEFDEDARALVHQPDLPDSRDPLRQLLDEAGSLWWDKAWPQGEPSEMEYVEVGFEDPHDLVRPGLQFLSGLVDDPDDDRPVFDYVHLPVPHGPWQLLPSGRNYDGPHPPMGGEYLGWGPSDLDQDLALAARSRQTLQMQWTDRLLGAIFDRLEELGRWDETMVVLTADHGFAFGRGRAVRRVSPDNQVEVGWVPLIIKNPGQAAPEISDANTWSSDVVPTVAAVTGVELTWETDGRSLTGPPRTDQTKPIVTPDATDFATILADEFGSDVVQLDADGLTANRQGLAAFLGLDPAWLATTPGDELAGWRHGRHRDLLGRSVDDVGECSASEARVSSQVAPAGWDEWLTGTLELQDPVPVWHEISLSGVDAIDLALVVDGVVVGWGPGRPASGSENIDFGVMVAEPLIEDMVAGGGLATSGVPPALYEITAGEDCGLSPIPAG